MKEELTKTNTFDQLKDALIRLAGLKPEINNELGLRINSCNSWASLLDLYAEKNIRSGLRKFESIKTLPIAEFFYLGYLNLVIKDNVLANAIEEGPEENFRDFIQHKSKELLLEKKALPSEYNDLLAVIQNVKPLTGDAAQRTNFRTLIWFCDKDKEFEKICDNFILRAKTNKKNNFVAKTLVERRYMAYQMKLAYLESKTPENQQIIYDFVKTIDTIDNEIVNQFNLSKDLIDSYNNSFDQLEHVMDPEYNHAKKRRNDKIETGLAIGIVSNLVLAIAAAGTCILFPPLTPIALPLAITFGVLSFAGSLAQFGPAIIPEILIQCTLGLFVAGCAALLSGGRGATLGTVFVKESLWSTPESQTRKYFGDDGYRGQMMTFFEAEKVKSKDILIASDDTNLLQAK